MRDFIYRGKNIRRVGFFGFGRSNLGVKEYLDREFPGLEYILRCDREVSTEGFDRVRCGADAYGVPYEDVVFISPGARRDREGFVKMESRGVILSSDAELFIESASMPVFAVSGSDGKSSTTTMAASILNAPAIGNIGVAMSPLLLKDNIECAVAELSSFQLLWHSPRVRRAVITNISPNHLDWHRSYEEYISAKENLLREAEERVFNLECKVSREMIGRYRADIVYSTKMCSKEMRKHVNADAYIGVDDGYIEANGVKILHTGAVKLKNAHTLTNLVCAIALTYGYATNEDVERVARGFCGLAHRCEEVGCFGGVRYIDSSIDSTPKRTATTLNSLSGEWIVILGGRNKGLDYREIVEPLRARSCLAVLTGESGKEIAKVLCGTGIEYIYEPDFDVAVRIAVSESVGMEGVILSPASTSFDRFRDFEERGNYFKELIRKIHSKE